MREFCWAGVRRKTASAGVVVLVLMLTLCLAPSLARASEDKTPPQVVSFSITPSEINTESADQTLSATVRITDDISGVSTPDDPGVMDQLVLAVKPLVGTQAAFFTMHRVSGDALDGVYAGTAKVPRGSKEGIWSVSWLRLADKIGNFVDLDWKDLEAKFGVGCASVTNTATVSDKTPPQVVSFSITPSEINTESADQTLSATVRITDDISGVSTPDDPGVMDQLVLAVKPLVGTQAAFFTMHRVSGDALDGVYAGTAKVPRGSKEGIWSVSWLRLADKIGNFVDLDWKDLEAKFGVGCASVTNTATVSDKTPPQVVSFSITPSEINTESADQTLSATVRITDDISGVSTPDDPGVMDQLVLAVKPLVGTQAAFFTMHRVSGDALDGVYAGTAKVPRGSKEGIWSVSWLRLADKIGNFVDLDAASLSTVLPGAEGTFVANTATAQQVLIERDWTISTDKTSVTFPTGTTVTRADDGRFAFYLMTAQDFVLDETIPQTDLDGVPIATLRFGIPGLNLTFSQPVRVSMAVGSQYDGYRLNVQSLTEDAEAWANEKVVDVANGRCSFTVSHATRFAASVAAPVLSRSTPASGKRGATVTIIGKGFGKKQGKSVVKFGSVKCGKYLSWSATRIKCTVPAKARFGRTKVRLIGPAGASNSLTFTVKR